MEKEEKRKLGKKSRKQGKEFEKKVRIFLEKAGWIVDRWTNQVEFEKLTFYPEGENSTRGKLIPSRPKFIFNPAMKRRIPMGMSSGFPDFICIRQQQYIRADGLKQYGCYEVIGVEAKTNGKLDREEKDKCDWLLDNGIFNSIMIASPGEKRGEIKLEEYRKI